MSNSRSDSFGTDEERPKKAAEPKPTTRITSQFRERHNMTYELDCAGTPIVVKMFPLDDSESTWRVEIRRNDPPDPSLPTAIPVDAPVVAIASGATRDVAFHAIRQWCDENRASGLSLIDWNAVAKALESVRAL